MIFSTPLIELPAKTELCRLTLTSTLYSRHGPIKEVSHCSRSLETTLPVKSPLPKNVTQQRSQPLQIQLFISFHTISLLLLARTLRTPRQTIGSLLVAQYLQQTLLQCQMKTSFCSTTERLVTIALNTTMRTTSLSPMLLTATISAIFTLLLVLNSSMTFTTLHVRDVNLTITSSCISFVTWSERPHTFHGELLLTVSRF